MKTLTITLALVLLAGGAISCRHSSKHQKPASAPAATATMPDSAPASAPASQGAQKISYVLKSKGSPVLSLTLPAGTVVDTIGETTNFKSAKGELRFSLWTAEGAKNVDDIDDAVAKINEIIKSEFKDFKPAAPKDLPVAGTTAKQFKGPGTEADDGDPGNAEVLVFAVGGKVFVACGHGEGDAPTAHHPFMMSVLETAQKP